ncbi:flagellar protein FlgJ [Crenobacter luteus]|uniref:flagellar biosynthesis protein FlgJ n=1 Tax=Crenobacter luteus TaxID=1452487 RepID=UPI001043AFA0|nr:flagellar biosynthesis protein FlgJ [Crenobacter luteus]TCP15625.1 flagellar protein FlgJ [Crenobacter luteus]
MIDPAIAQAGAGAGSANPDKAVAPPSDAYRKKAGEAAEAFEALFIREMLSQMRKVTREIAGDDSVFASTIHGDMMDFADKAVAEQVARSRVFGIANAILAQLLPAEPAPPAAFKENAPPVASLSQGEGLSAFAAPLPLNRNPSRP